MDPYVQFNDYIECCCHIMALYRNSRSFSQNDLEIIVWKIDIYYLGKKQILNLNYNPK
jgi:hypothetical protein